MILLKNRCAVLNLILAVDILLLSEVDAAVKELKVETVSRPDSCYPQAAPGDEVAVHYTGKLDNGVVFDSSVHAKRDPIAFVLGTGRVIPGWEQGIVGMCVGEKRMLTIPPHLGYGAKGHPPTIPGDSTLIFETELMSLKSKPVDDQILKTLRLLAIPAFIMYLLYYLYNKYNQDVESNTKSTKSKDKRNKKRK